MYLYRYVIIISLSINKPFGRYVSKKKTRTTIAAAVISVGRVMANEYLNSRTKKK